MADDLAFRALRKDDKIDTNALDALIRETDQIGKKRATRTLSDDLSLMVKSEARQPSGRPVSLCICGGHSVSDCELEETAAAARYTRPIRLRPRPESQRTYGLYSLYVGNLSEPETGGSRPSSGGARSRTASIATSTETLTEAGQRRTSGEFSARVRPFLRVSSEPECDLGPAVSRGRASTAPPSPGPASSDSRLDSLLEGLQLHETPAASQRQHRPPRLTDTLRALADIEAERIPRAMAALDSLTAGQRPPREAVSAAPEDTDTSPATRQSPPPSSQTPSTSTAPPSPSQSVSNSAAPPSPSQPPSATSTAPPSPSQPPSAITAAPPPPGAPPSTTSAAPPPLSTTSTALPSPVDRPNTSAAPPSPRERSESPPLAAARPPATGEEASVRPRPRPRPASPEAADSAEAVRKGELTSDLWLAGSLLVCVLQLLGVSALPAALAVLAVLLVAAALVL